jgi:hypothetical protein
VIGAAGMRRLVNPDDPLGPVDQDPDEIRRAACELVAPDNVCRPPDAAPPDVGNPSTDGAGGLAAVFEIVVWLLFFALVALLVVIVVRAVMSGRIGTRRRRKPPASADEDDEVEVLAQVAVDRSREPADWRRHAEEHRRAGRHREAIRCRYRALVGDLARRGLIDEIPGRTSGEERSQMAVVAPAGSSAFSAAAEIFDNAWFGDVPVTEADVQQIEALEADVLAVAGGSRHRAATMSPGP